jgi:hypothetical protein
MQNIRPISALLGIALAFVAFDRCLAAEGLQAIEIPGDRAFMESITAGGPDGILYVSSLASGGVARIKPGASKAEEWISPAHLEAVHHLAFLPMQSPTPYGSARMICLVSASMAQVVQLVVTSRASIFRQGMAR